MSQKILKVAGYCRVSHDEQKRFGYSISAQTEAIEKWAADKGHKIVNMYIDEGFSASNMRRPNLQEMLDDLQDIDAIVFTRLDRLSRNVLEANKMLELLKQNDVAMIAISEDNIDTSTANGMFMFNLKVNLAEHELNKGSERIKAVFDYKIKNGQPVSGAIPYGYKIVVQDGVKRVVKDEAVAHIVDETFSYFLTHQSIRKTTTYINNKYGTTRCFEAYSALLKKEFYTGSYRGNDNFTEPYIDRETHERLIEITNRNIRVKRNETTYIFSGLVLCPVCGAKMDGSSAKGGGGSRLHYYRCKRRYRSRTCDNSFHTREYVIEPYLVENLDRLLSAHIAKISEVDACKKDSPQALIKSLKAELDNLNYMFMKKRIDVNTYDRLYEQTDAELKKVMATAPKKSNADLHRDILNSGWRTIYDSMTRENKRTFWRAIVKSIVVDFDNNVKVTFL